MIVLLSDFTLNKQCAVQFGRAIGDHTILSLDALSSNNTSNNHGDLFLFDVTNQANIITKYTPKELARLLVMAGLLDGVEHIYLIVPDMDPEHTLIEFSHNMALAFLEYHQRQVKIHIVSHLSHDATIIVPPITSTDWEIHGINRYEIADSSLDGHDNFTIHEDRELLWKGPDLISYLNKKEQTYDGKSYAWS